MVLGGALDGGGLALGAFDDQGDDEALDIQGSTTLNGTCTHLMVQKLSADSTQGMLGRKIVSFR